jgi:dephospho-CoA kinase
VIIAVTGNIGSGKSTVAKMLSAALGGEYLDCDQVCRARMERGQEGYRACLNLFGTRFFGPEGRLDRAALRQAAFGDAAVRQALEGILHPLVAEEIARRAAAGEAAGRHLVAEVPLLYELGWQEKFSLVVVVAGGREQAQARAGLRDGVARGEIARIEATQLPLAEKIIQADVVINNDGIFAATFLQTNWLATRVRRMTKGSVATAARQKGELKSLTG